MSAEEIAAARRVASMIATYDEHAALTEVERAAIFLARKVLAALDENEHLRQEVVKGAKAG